MRETGKPQELLTEAHAILGQGQLSLAKYLLIVAEEDNPGLNIEDIPAFFRHVLERVDWQRDLHFQTQTTIDTLDYSGTGLNAGSKVVIAAAGTKCRDLPTTIPVGSDLPEGFRNPRIALPGVLVIEAPAFRRPDTEVGAARLAIDFRSPLGASACASFRCGSWRMIRSLPRGRQAIFCGSRLRARTRRRTSTASRLPSIKNIGAAEAR